MTDFTRRNVLKTGAVAGVGIITGLSLCTTREAKASSAFHPYGYPLAGLDVEATRQLAYDGYYGIELSDEVTHKHCAFATFHSLISQLAEEVGSPYTEIPTQMMEWASGGVAGYATLCGAINGVCAAIGIICDKNDATAFISDLLNWVYETELPLPLSESGLDINPAGIDGELTQSVAGSNLCHVSVTKWCLASGFASGSTERSERCARLAGDIAARAVEMLNNSVTLNGIVPRDNSVCGQCHYKGKDFDGGQFTRGKMDCTSCHVDLKKVSEVGHHAGLINAKE